MVCHNELHNDYTCKNAIEDLDSALVRPKFTMNELKMMQEFKKYFPSLFQIENYTFNK